MVVVWKKNVLKHYFWTNGTNVFLQIWSVLGSVDG